MPYLDITGNRFDKSLNRVCNRFKLCLCDNKCSFVSTAILIWSFIKLCELFKCVPSFKYISRRLKPDDGLIVVLKPDPRNNSSRSIRVV